MSISGMIQRVLNKLARDSYWYNHIAFGDCRKFWLHRTFDLDVVNLGSSSSVAAFDYSGHPELKAANWAMTPQTLVADFEILRNYSCYLKKGATVIIPLCPFSCLGGNNDDIADKYYTVLNIASMPHASYRRQQQQMQMKNNPWRYYPLAQLIARKPKVSNLDAAAFEADAKMRMESWRKEFSMIRFTDPLSLVNQDAFHDGAKILGQMVDYCIEREYRPVVVMPPVSEAMRIQFTPEMKKLFIDDFVKEGIGEKVVFLDYFEDGRFDVADFQNSFMLNAEGAKKFTDVVLKDAEVVR